MKDKIFDFPARERHACILFMLLGAAALGVGFVSTPQRAWANLLLNAVYFTTLGVFGVFFLALHHLTGARWSEVIRKIPEAMGRFVPVGGALMLLSLFGVHHLYEWAHAGAVHGSKHFYLSPAFFGLRMAAVLGLWAWFAARLRRLSQSPGRLRWSAVFIVVFALTFAVATFDWLMSLEPHWFSTVFAVYHFSGVFVAGIAAIAMMVITLKNIRVLNEVNENHIHDLGKYLFAFTMFWAYIWYCQFMLIWYGNIPEETVYYVHRLKDDWSWLFYFNFFLNFIVPFAVLLSRAAKRSAAMVFRVSVVLLVGHWLDLYLMIMPPVTGAASNIGLFEVAVALGFAGAFTYTTGRALSGEPVLPPVSDLLSESLHHHQ